MAKHPVPAHLLLYPHGGPVEFDDIGNLLLEKGVFIKELLAVIGNEYASLTPLSTVNYHLNVFCNMSCHHCFSDFPEIKKDHFKFEQAKEIVTQIASLPGVRKINFSGGEPTSFPEILDLIRHAKSLGLETSIVTNGFNFLHGKEDVTEYREVLDILALSLDEFDSDANIKIGRSVKGRTLEYGKIHEFSKTLHESGIKLKINTVVTKNNYSSSLFEMISELKPIRWKILRALPVLDQIKGKGKDVFVSSDEYGLFIKANKTGAEKLGVVVVGEDNADMTGSYIMVSPDGRFFNNVEGKHSYSLPILQVGIQRALESTPYFRERFLHRDGCYEA